MVTIHEEGRSPVFVSFKTALSRLPDDLATFEAVTLALFLGEPVSVVLKDGNGRPASMHLTEKANPQIEMFKEPTDEVETLGSRLFLYTSDATALIEVPVEVALPRNRRKVGQRHHRRNDELHARARPRLHLHD